MKLIVRPIAEARGVMNAKQLADKVGLHNKSAYKIWSGEAEAISMEVLGKLCTALEAEPSWLLKQIPDSQPLPDKKRKKKR